MISKSRIKLIHSLHQKKFRREEKLFIVEGEKVVKELLQSGWDVEAIYGTDSFFRDLEGNHRIAKTTEVVLIDENELKKISALTTAQRVLAVVKIPEATTANNEKGIKLLLDNISDPGNLGTIIRIADWFGVKEIICSNETVDCFNPKVVQATMGSLFHVNIFYENIQEYLNHNSTELNLPVYGMVLDGANIYDSELPGDAIIILGNEADGLSASAAEYLTHKITIPSFESKAESLNVAIAAGIICYEFRRSQK